MKKIMSIAAVVLFVAGSVAFAGGGCQSESKKSACSAQKDASASKECDSKKDAKKCSEKSAEKCTK